MIRRDFLKLFGGGTIYLPLIFKSVQPAALAPANGYFVNSVNGNDGNDGTSALTPFRTIGRLLQETIQPYSIINLARGSHWREQLTIAADNVTIQAYGSGARPLLDCSTIATGFTKTAGQTNVYQAGITTNYTPNEPGFVGVWENSIRLVIATSLANCDSTPGSYYVSSHDAVNITVYIHASGSSNVATNGKTYEVSNRLSGIYSWFANRTIVEGIACRRNYSKGGSIKVGKNSILRDCFITEGNSHNAYMRAGGSAYNCIFEDAYHTAGSTLLVINDDNLAGEHSVISGCTFRLAGLDSPNDALVGVMNAHNNVSGSFGTIIVEDCTFENFSTAGGMIFPNDVDDVYLINPVYINCRMGVTYCGALQSYTVIGGSFTSNVPNQRAISLTSPGAPLNVDGFVINQQGTTDVGEITLTTAYELALKNVVLNAGSDVRAALYCSNAGANITIENLNCNNAGGWSWIYNIVAGATFASDYNRFGGTNFNMQIGGQTYTSLAAYQAATGQDTHSLVG